MNLLVATTKFYDSTFIWESSTRHSSIPRSIVWQADFILAPTPGIIGTRWIKNRNGAAPSSWDSRTLVKDYIKDTIVLIGRFEGATEKLSDFMSMSLHEKELDFTCILFKRSDMLPHNIFEQIHAYAINNT